MNTIIAGNSHTVALRKALEKSQPGTKIFDVCTLGSSGKERDLFFSLDQNGVSFLPRYWDANLKNFSGSSFLNREIRWGFLLGSSSHDIYQDKFWRDAEPAEICDAKKQPISIGVLDACITDLFKETIKFFRQLKKARIDYFVVSGPPPRADHPCITNGTNPRVVAYIDSRMKILLEQFLKSENIDFLASPKSVENVDGLLKEEFANAKTYNGVFDTHHANTRYGEFMNQKISEYLSNSHD